MEQELFNECFKRHNIGVNTGVNTGITIGFNREELDKIGKSNTEEYISYLKKKHI